MSWAEFWSPPPDLSWEWLWWKLVYQPLTGKVMWDGGIPTDPAELAASLPIEAPNFVKLFGLAPSTSATPTPQPSAPDSPTLSNSSRDLSDSWDHLSATSSQRSAPTKQALPTIPASIKPSKDLTVTWIGQSTSFVQMDGVGFLTDPVWAHRTVNTRLAPPRLCPPPCALSDIAHAIQVVLVSHDHFDQ